MRPGLSRVQLGEEQVGPAEMDTWSIHITQLRACMAQHCSVKSSTEVHTLQVWMILAFHDSWI
jgi:hypothetical protein